MSEFSKTIASHTRQVKARLEELRQLVLDTAAQTEGVGNNPEKHAMYFHCQSGLVELFKERYGRALKYEGNRALIFNANETLPVEIVSHCISLALTHHLRKTSRNKSAKKK